MASVYTARDSRIGSGGVGQPLKSEPPVSPNFSVHLGIVALVFLIVFSFSLFADPRQPVKKEKRYSMTTSVIIPCTAYHFKHLFELLSHYQRQTFIPNEVVISLSETAQIHESEIDALENYSWPFRIAIVRHPFKKSAGENRNIACANATGDILICQDADDLPHPQRVEIVKYIFEKYKVDHLIHRWNGAEECLSKRYQISKIPVLSFSRYSDILTRLSYLHNGNICLLSKVAKKIAWQPNISEDRDVQFNEEVYKQFKHNLVIPTELILYRPTLSAFRHQKNLDQNKS